jgi:hypothetical protein
MSRAKIALVLRKRLKRERGVGGSPPEAEAVPATVSGERDVHVRRDIVIHAASHWARR